MRPLLCYTSQWERWVRQQQSVTRELIAVSGERQRYVERLMNTFEAEMLESAPQYRVYGECTPPESATVGEAAVRYKVATLVPPVLLRARDLFVRRFNDVITSLPEQVSNRSPAVLITETLVQTFSFPNEHHKVNLCSVTKIVCHSIKPFPSVLR